MDNSRLLLFLVISLGFVVLYSQLMKWRFPHGLPGSPAALATPTPIPEKNAASNSTPVNANTVAAPSKTTGATISAASGRYIEIDTDLYTAEVTTVGGRLASYKLNRYRETAATNSPPYQMIPPADRLPLGLIVYQGNSSNNDAQIQYNTAAPSRLVTAPGRDAVVELDGDGPGGLKLHKSFTFKEDSYVFAITGTASVPAPGKISGIGLTMSRPLDVLEGYRDIPILQADINDKVISEDQKALIKGAQPLTGKISFAGFGDRYFLSVFLPVQPTSGILTMDYSGDEADAQLVFDGPSEVQSRVYMGPKQLTLLEEAGPSLSKAINFGWSRVIALPFLELLQIFHRIAPNYGLAIILLTIVVRLLMLPMSIKGQRSMMRMQRLQPQVERIREKFKDDQERLNKEMVELYKRNHVNPLGGCLPMAVQMPVFIGLYEALLNATQLRHAPFVGWIRDLSAPDCVVIRGMPAIPFTHCHGIPVLVILMTITSFLMQWISPRQPDPNQQKMMMYMPVLFSLIFIDLPAGLTLYYFASNLLGIVQQFVLNREFNQYTPAT